MSPKIARPNWGRGYLQPEVLRELLDEHLSNHADHTHHLWTLWHQEFIEFHYVEQIRESA